MKNKAASRRPITCTLSCPCGAPIIVDSRRPEGVQVCIVCRMSLKVIVGTDPHTGKRRIGILVAPQAVTTVTETVKAPARREPAAGARKTRTRPPLSGIRNPKCACGGKVPVNLGDVDALYTCPWCGACYTAVSKRDAKTGLDIPLLIPIATVPLDPPTEDLLIEENKESARTGAFSMTPDVVGAQALKSRGETVFMSCFCGREIELNPDENRQDGKCPGCGLGFQVVMAVEPGTHQPMVITLPRSQPVAKDQTAAG
jgi:hypothetical protein